jgi:hypothetical protein
MGINAVFAPQLGCGAGTLAWTDVRPILERFLEPWLTIVDSTVPTEAA